MFGLSLRETALAAVMLLPAVLFLAGQIRPQVQRHMPGLSRGWAGGLAVFGVFWAALLLLALGAVFISTFRVIGGTENANLGLGALIVAFLGAPFLVWTTVLKDRTVRYQKEGHITDRLAKAVDMLGAEKTIDKIGRPVVIWTGRVTDTEITGRAYELYMKRAEVAPRAERTRIVLEERDGNESPKLIKRQWETARTVIEWQDTKQERSEEERLGLQKGEVVGEVGDWKTFSRSEPNIEVRIGALLALERLAQDSTKDDSGRDHVRVMEILCAYIRKNAPVDSAEPLAFPKSFDSIDIDKKRESNQLKISPNYTPRADIQMAIEVIGRRSKEQILIEKRHPSHHGNGYRLELFRTNLRYVSFENLNFANASFYNSEMQMTYSNGANFSGANFIYAQFTASSAKGADFTNAHLEGADLTDAALVGAKLLDITVLSTHFIRSNLLEATIRLPDKDKANQNGRAFFFDCDLRAALFEGDLRGCSFSTHPKNQKTTPIKERFVRFRNCNLGQVDQFFPFEQLILEDFPLRFLTDSFGDASVTLIDEKYRPEHWPKHVLSDEAFDQEYAKWLANPAAYKPPP